MLNRDEKKMDTEMNLIEDFHKKIEKQFLDEVRIKNDDEIARIENQILILQREKERLQSMEKALRIH